MANQEQEELKLTVVLDDQASAQLGRLQAALNNIGQAAGPAGTGLNQLGQALRGAGGHAKNLHGSLGGMAARGGFIGGFFFEIGRGVEQMGEKFAKATLDIKAYADSMVELENASRRAATSAAQFQRNVATMRESGISAADAAKQIQGLADALGDLQREQSTVRANLFAGLRGQEFEDMRRLIQRVQTSDRQTALNEIKKFGTDIRAYWTSLGQAERGAKAEREFYAVLGVPDLDKLRLKLESITPEIERMYNMRMENAQRFQTAVEKQSDAWERSVRSVQATAFRVLPIRETAEGLAELSEQIAHWFEDWEGSITAANDELEKKEFAEEGFWFDLFTKLGITGKRTRGQEEREEGAPQEPGAIPLPRPRPPIQTWRIPPRPDLPQRFMGGEAATGANGPGNTLDVASLGVPSIGDLLKPQAGGGITVPSDDFAGTGWRGLPMSKRVLDLRGESPVPVVLEENTEEMETLADELNRLNEFLAPEMMEIMKAIMGDTSAFHNAPMGGAAGESDPVKLPASVPQPGGGAAAEARDYSAAGFRGGAAAAQEAAAKLRSGVAGSVDAALKMIGLNENRDQAKLKDFMQTGGRNLSRDDAAWCARFVNAINVSAGLPSLESVVGTDRSWSSLAFKDWGKGVGPDQELQAGDVMIKERKGGGHVGVYTGNYRVNPDTGQTEYEMLSGNIGGSRRAGHGGEVNLTYETLATGASGGKKGETAAGAGHGNIISVRRGERPAEVAYTGPEEGGGKGKRLDPVEIPNATETAATNELAATNEPIEIAAKGKRGGGAGKLPPAVPFSLPETAPFFSEQEQNQRLESAQERRVPPQYPGTFPGRSYREGEEIPGEHGYTSSILKGWEKHQESEQERIGPGMDLGGTWMFPQERRTSLTDQGAALDLDQSSGAALDRATNSQIQVNQSGRLQVDVEAPAGTSVSAEGAGVFTNTETNRSVPMDTEV